MWCVYFYSSLGSLSFGMWNDFQLKPGYFGHYVVNLWILHKFPGLANFLWHCSIRGEGWYLLITARKEEKSNFPHSAAIDIQGREGILILPGWAGGSHPSLSSEGATATGRVRRVSLLLYTWPPPDQGAGLGWALCYWVVVKVLMCLHWASSETTQVGRKRETLLPLGKTQGKAIKHKKRQLAPLGSAYPHASRGVLSFACLIKLWVVTLVCLFKSLLWWDRT